MINVAVDYLTNDGAGPETGLTQSPAHRVIPVSRLGTYTRFFEIGSLRTRLPVAA